jgi:ribose transport system substrate-binding protein
MAVKQRLTRARMAAVLVTAGVVVAGCGSSSNNSGSSASASTTSAATTGGATTAATTQTSGGGSASTGKSYNIALITNDLSPYYTTINAGAQAAAKKLGVKVTWGAAAQDALNAQVQYVQGVTARKPDAILMSVFDSKGEVGTMQQIKSAGIPVITVDADISQPSLRLGFIGSDNTAGGRLAAETMAKLVPKGATVAHEGYTPGIESVDDRKAGWWAGVKAAGLKDGGDEYDQASDATATAAASALLQRNSSLAGIFSDYEVGAVGTAAAVRQAGKIGSVKVIGFDAAPDEVAQLKSGAITALIVQKAYSMGYDAVQEMVAHLRTGASVPKTKMVPFVVATKANVDTPAIKKYIYRAASNG